MLLSDAQLRVLTASRIGIVPTVAINVFEKSQKRKSGEKKSDKIDEVDDTSPESKSPKKVASPVAHSTAAAAPPPPLIPRSSDSALAATLALSPPLASASSTISSASAIISISSQQQQQQKACDTVCVEPQPPSEEEEDETDSELEADKELLVHMVVSFSRLQTAMKRYCDLTSAFAVFGIMLMIAVRILEMRDGWEDGTKFLVINVLRALNSLSTVCLLVFLFLYYSAAEDYDRLNREYLRSPYCWRSHTILLFVVEMLICAVHTVPFVHVSTDTSLPRYEVPPFSSLLLLFPVALHCIEAALIARVSLFAFGSRRATAQRFPPIHGSC